MKGRANLLWSWGCDCLMLYDTRLVVYKLSSEEKDVIYLRANGDTDGHPHCVTGPAARIKVQRYLKVTKVSIINSNQGSQWWHYCINLIGLLIEQPRRVFWGLQFWGGNKKK